MTLAALTGALQRALNWVKDAYLAVVDWIDANPQKSLWIAVACIVAVAVI